MRRAGQFLIIILSLIHAAGTHAQETGQDTTHHLEAVMVEAYQPGGPLFTLPGSLSVLTGAGMIPTDGTNLASALNSLPGVSMQSGTLATGRIVIRGMGSRTPYNTNRIRVYLNDIPITSADGVSSPEDIDLLSLGRLEVIKGPSSALYGSGLGGSLNLYTPDQIPAGGAFGIQYGSYNTWKSHLSGTLKRGNSAITSSLSRLTSDGYRENNSYRRNTSVTSARFGQNRWTLRATLLLTDVHAGIPSSLGKTLFDSLPQSAAPNWKAIGGFKEYQKVITGISLENRLLHRLVNRLTLFGKWNDSYEKRPFNNLDDLSLSGGFRNRLHYHTARADYIAGAEWIHEQYSWKLEEGETRINENRERRRQINLFAMINYRPSSKVNISAAAALNRVSYRLTDLYDQNGDQSVGRAFPWIFSPRIGISYSPLNRWAVYASAGHGYSYPSPEETLLPLGEVNPEIRPEQGFQYEAGTRLSFWKDRISMDGAFYWIELNDLLITKRLTEDIFTGMNAGKTRHQGLELLVNMQLVKRVGFPGELDVTMNYTRSFNRFIDFTDDGIIYDGNRLPGIPGRWWQFQINWAPAGWAGLLARINYSGDQYLNDSNTLTSPGFLLADIKLTGTIRLKKNGALQLHAGINNLADIRHASMLVVNARGFGSGEPRYYYPGLPRHGYLGLLFTPGPGRLTPSRTKG